MTPGLWSVFSLLVYLHQAISSLKISLTTLGVADINYTSCLGFSLPHQVFINQRGGVKTLSPGGDEPDLSPASVPCWKYNPGYDSSPLGVSVAHGRLEPTSLIMRIKHDSKLLKDLIMVAVDRKHSGRVTCCHCCCYYYFDRHVMS